MTQKIIWITGASRGIGSALLEHFALDNAIVVGTATTESGAEKITEHLKSLGKPGKGFVLNVTSPDSITAFLAAAETAFGMPQVLINNAAITRDNLFLRMKEEEWDSVIATNLTGVFKLTKAVIKGMLKARFGRIINITSVVATMGNPGQANYCAAKAGVIGLTKSLAQEIGSRNITVNAIAPGFIQTDMTAILPEAQQQQYLANIPVGRFGTPLEIAHAAGFLASEGAGYITGQTLHVNGGLLMV